MLPYLSLALYPPSPFSITLAGDSNRTIDLYLWLHEAKLEGVDMRDAAKPTVISCLPACCVGFVSLLALMGTYLPVFTSTEVHPLQLLLNVQHRATCSTCFGNITFR
jgi:hypothetical protein